MIQENMIGNSPSGAVFSDCNKYRFILWRIWDASLPKVMFVGLNPSTANAYQDDATIRSVVRWAKLWGYGGIYMGNCFPFISTDPTQLQGSANIPDNDKYLKCVAKRCKDIVFAWGNFDIVNTHSRDIEMTVLFPNASCLHKNKNGSPKHPLYVKATTPLINW